MLGPDGEGLGQGSTLWIRSIALAVGIHDPLPDLHNIESCSEDRNWERQVAQSTLEVFPAL